MEPLFEETHESLVQSYLEDSPSKAIPSSYYNQTNGDNFGDFHYQLDSLFQTPDPGSPEKILDNSYVQQQLNVGMVTVDLYNSFPCEFCPQSFDSAHDLFAHKRLYETSCTLCSGNHCINNCNYIQLKCSTCKAPLFKCLKEEAKTAGNLQCIECTKKVVIKPAKVKVDCKGCGKTSYRVESKVNDSLCFQCSTKGKFYNKIISCSSCSKKFKCPKDQVETRCFKCCANFFTCLRCGDKFPTLLQLNQHELSDNCVKTAPGLVARQCATCSSYFSTAESRTNPNCSKCSSVEGSLIRPCRNCNVLFETPMRKPLLVCNDCMLIIAKPYIKPPAKPRLSTKGPTKSKPNGQILTNGSHVNSELKWDSLSETINSVAENSGFTENVNSTSENLNNTWQEAVAAAGKPAYSEGTLKMFFDWPGNMDIDNAEPEGRAVPRTNQKVKNVTPPIRGKPALENGTGNEQPKQSAMLLTCSQCSVKFKWYHRGIIEANIKCPSCKLKNYTSKPNPLRKSATLTTTSSLLSINSELGNGGEVSILGKQLIGFNRQQKPILVDKNGFNRATPGNQNNPPILNSRPTPPKVAKVLPSVNLNASVNKNRLNYKIVEKQLSQVGTKMEKFSVVKPLAKSANGFEEIIIEELDDFSLNQNASGAAEDPLSCVENSTDDESVNGDGVQVLMNNAPGTSGSLRKNPKFITLPLTPAPKRKQALTPMQSNFLDDDIQCLSDYVSPVKSQKVEVASPIIDLSSCDEATTPVIQSKSDF